MSIQRYVYIWIAVMMIGTTGADIYCVKGQPQRILLDTDMDTDDFFALLYLLKLNRSELDLQVHILVLICCHVCLITRF